MEAIHVKKSNTEMFQAHTFILSQTLSIAAPMALKCAVELGLAEILHRHTRPLSLHELAIAASIPQEKEIMLHRIMRVLVRQSIFAVQKNNDDDEDEYEDHETSRTSSTLYKLTPYSRVLLKDGQNMSAYVLALLDEVLVKPWYFMSEWLRTTEGSPSPSNLAYGGKCFWEVASGQPRINKLFNEAMAADAKCVIKTAIAECPDVFKGLRSLVDVGGGTGTTVTLLSEAFPEVKCVVFDLPHVVATLPRDKNFCAIGGDMFEYIPPANAILLKSILHDWADDECVKILKKCKNAIPSKQSGGKIIIIEMVVNSNPNKSKVVETHLYFDLTMMIGVEGKERTEREWRKIFNDAGFEKYKIYPMLSAYCVIELYP